MLDIKLNPWKSSWGISKYALEAAGEMCDQIQWKIHTTETVLSFHPTMIIRAKKDIDHIDAKVDIQYKWKKAGWTHISDPVEIPSVEQNVHILE